MPERHRTLHAVVEWSWNLLAQDARAALRTLSVFPGGFGGEAAERVLGEDALLLLEQLAGQSLLTVAETPAGVRFRMLETVREFSAARRAEAGGDEEAVSRFLAWARDFGVAYHDALFGSDAQAAWERIKAEQDNLVLALRHALACTDNPTTAAVTAILASLWSTGTNFPRLAAIAADTGPPLSHYRPGPEYVEVARTAAVLGAATVFMGSGPRAVRQLVTLRRLPPAPPDTLMRATALVLSAIPEIRPPGYDVLRELCEGAGDSEQPLLSGIAECVACYVWEFEHDIDRALVSARRAVAGLAAVDNPSVQLMVHSRLSELCLRTGRGEEAYEHLQASLKVLPRLGDGHDYIGIRSLLVLACLQRGETDEADYWLRQAESDSTPQQDDFYRPDLGGRAEIALARGLTEVGLGLWRGAVERMLAALLLRDGDARLDPWAFLIQSVAVTAHAHRRAARAGHGGGRPAAAAAADAAVRSGRLALRTPVVRDAAAQPRHGGAHIRRHRCRTDDRAGRTAGGDARVPADDVGGPRPQGGGRRRQGGVRRRGVGVRRPGAGRVAGGSPRCHGRYFGSRLKDAVDQR